MASTDSHAKSAYRGETAARYEQDRVLEPLWQIEQEFVRQWAAGLPPDGTVLDVPAGTGRFVELLVARGLKVHAMDISDDMLVELRKRRPVSDPAVLITRGDAEHLPCEDNSVDYILSWRFLHLISLPAIDRVLAEFRRVCRKRIVIEVLPVRTGGLIGLFPPALKAVLRPLRRLLAKGRGKTPWSHIPSFVHAERDLLKLFARNHLVVLEKVTLANYGGLPVRVYTLERAAVKK